MNEVLGMFDITSAARRMSGLKTVSVEIAKILIQRSMPVIKTAIDFGAGMPGNETRKNTLAHIEWHANELINQVRNGAKLNSVYAPGNDLKKWALQAFIEANGVEAGLDAAAANWNAMWEEITEALKNLPETAAKAVVSAAAGVAKGAVEGAFGVPWWVVALGAVTVAVGVGYGVNYVRGKLGNG